MFHLVQKHVLLDKVKRLAYKLNGKTRLGIQQDLEEIAGHG
jgi:hypothetical protein